MYKITNHQPLEESIYVPIPWDDDFTIKNVRSHAAIPFPADGKTAFHENALCFDDWLGMKSQSGSSFDSVMFRHVWDTVMMAFHQSNLGTPAHPKGTLFEHKYWFDYTEWLKKGPEATLLPAALGRGGLRTFDPDVPVFLDELCKHSKHLKTRKQIEKSKKEEFDYAKLPDHPEMKIENKTGIEKYKVVLQPMRKKGDPKRLGGFLLWIFVIDPRWSLDEGRTNVINTINLHAKAVASKQFPASGGTPTTRNLKLNADLQEIVATQSHDGIATQYFTHPYWRLGVCKNYADLVEIAEEENELRSREEKHVCDSCKSCLRRWGSNAHKRCDRCWETVRKPDPENEGAFVEIRRHVVRMAPHPSQTLANRPPEDVRFVSKLGLSNFDASDRNRDSSFEEVDVSRKRDRDGRISFYHDRFRDFEKFTRNEAPDDGRRGRLDDLPEDEESIDRAGGDDRAHRGPKDRPRRRDREKRGSTATVSTEEDEDVTMSDTEQKSTNGKSAETERSYEKLLRDRTADVYRDPNADDAYNFCNLFTPERALVLAEYFGMDVAGATEKIFRTESDDKSWSLRSVPHPSSLEKKDDGPEAPETPATTEDGISSPVYAFEKDYGCYDKLYLMIIDHFVWTNFEGTGLKTRYFPWVDKLESPWHRFVDIEMPRSKTGRSLKRRRDFGYDSEEDDSDGGDFDDSDEEEEIDRGRRSKNSRKKHPRKKLKTTRADPGYVHSFSVEPMLQKIAQEREVDTSALTLGGKFIRTANRVDGKRSYRTKVKAYSQAARKDEVTKIAEMFAGWKKSFGFYSEIAWEQIREKGEEMKIDASLRTAREGSSAVTGKFDRVAEKRKFYVPSKFSRDYYASVDDYEKTANFYLFRCMLKGSDSVLTEPFTEICRFFCSELLGKNASRGKLGTLTVCHHYDPGVSILGSHMQRRGMQVRWKCHIFFYWAEFLLIYYGLVGVYRHEFDLHPAFIITGDKAIGKSNLLSLLPHLLIKNTTKDKFAGSSKHNYADLSQSDFIVRYDELPPWVISRDGNRNSGFTADADVNLQKCAMTLGFFVYYALSLWDIGLPRKARIPEAIFTPHVQSPVIVANNFGPNTVDAALRDRFTVIPLPDHINHREDDDSKENCEKITAAFYGNADGAGGRNESPSDRRRDQKLAVKPTKYRDQIKAFQCKASGSSSKPDEQTVFDFSTMQCLHAVVEKMIAVGSLPSPDMSLLYQVLMRVVEHVESGNSCSLAMGIRAFQSIGEEARSMVIEDAKLNAFFVNCRDRTRIDEKSVMDVKPYLWCQLHHAIFAITLQRNKIVDPYFSTVIFTAVSTICNFRYLLYKAVTKKLFQSYKKIEDEAEEKMVRFENSPADLEREIQEKEDREIAKRYKSAAVLIQLYVESLPREFRSPFKKRTGAKSQNLYWERVVEPEKLSEDLPEAFVDETDLDEDPGEDRGPSPADAAKPNAQKTAAPTAPVARGFGIEKPKYPENEKRKPIEMWNLNYVCVKIEAPTWTLAKAKLVEDLQRKMNKDTKLSQPDIDGIFEKMKSKMRVKVPYALEPCTHDDLVQFHNKWEKIKKEYIAELGPKGALGGGDNGVDLDGGRPEEIDVFFEDPIFDAFVVGKLKKSLPSSFSGEMPLSFPLFNVSFEKNAEMPVIKENQETVKDKRTFIFCFNVHATAYDSRDAENLLVEALRSISYKGLRPRSKLLTGFVKGALNSGEFKTMSIDPNPGASSFELYSSEDPNAKIASVLNFSQSIIESQMKDMEENIRTMGDGNPSAQSRGSTEKSAKEKQREAIADGFAQLSENPIASPASLYDNTSTYARRSPEKKENTFVTKDLDDHFAEEWFVKAGIPMVYESVIDEQTGVEKRVPKWLFKPENRPDLVELRPLPTEHNQRVRNLYHSWRNPKTKAAIERYHKNGRLSKKEILESKAAYEAACKEYEATASWLEERVFKSPSQSTDGGVQIPISDKEKRRAERTKPLYS